MNKNIIFLILVTFFNPTLASASDILSLAINSDNRVGIATEAPETTFHVVGDTTLEGATYIETTYTPCYAPSNETTVCGNYDMCFLSYVELSAPKGWYNYTKPYCDLTISSDGQQKRPNWTLESVGYGCEAICLIFG